MNRKQLIVLLVAAAWISIVALIPWNPKAQHLSASDQEKGGFASQREQRLEKKSGLARVQAIIFWHVRP